MDFSHVVFVVQTRSYFLTFLRLVISAFPSVPIYEIHWTASQSENTRKVLQDKGLHLERNGSL